MVFRKRILSLTVALAFGALSAFASSPQTSTKTASPAASKDKAQPKAHVLRGSVVAVSNDVLTVRSGGKDMTFKLDPSTQKPPSIGPGSQIAVTYRDEGKQHVANSVELSAAKAPASSSSKKK